ncbi:unnamed protein product [Nippostrongylus brasiliensis]|uniref:Translation initiation factor eIF-2B subunit epsilon (inferred by orthology to a human protein) n=1 Tax=Nippostrongylus brasiliensis TaxID=27835 RepID=A0A0N4XZ00_NIPBR|nr:unnamed protein product [Nippostrongylus brasiliensis]
MERWFHPMTLENMNCDVHFSALPGNVYLQINEAELGRLAPCRGAPKQSHNVTIGSECRIDETVSVSCSSIGKGTQIGENTRIINCIIGEKCVIGSDCFIEDSVLGDDVRLPNEVHLQKQSVISEQVNYPGDLDVPENSAVCSTTPHEDFEELVKYKKTGDVFIWSLFNGDPFWNARRPADSGNGSMGDGEMHNLILEINSSKLAYNISMEDVAKHVFLAFLSLPGNETWTRLKELCTKWKLLFKNYYKPKKSQVQLLLAIEDRYKESTAEFGPMVTRLVHFLYNDLDVIEEEAILEWAESLDQSSELRRIMKPIVDWLQEDSEEEDDDSEED